MITWENYEEFMMMYADGELTTAEEAALIAFTDQHPELKKELALYSATHIAPDTTQVYANKAALLKPVPAGRAMAFPVWARYSIAAGIAALLFIPLYRHITNEHTTPLAMTDTTSRKPQPTATVTQPAIVANNVTAQQETTTQVHKITVDQHRHESKETRMAVAPVVKQQHTTSHPVQEVAITKESNAIAQLPVATAQSLPAANHAPTAAQPVDEPQYTVATTTDEPAARRTLWDVLPLKESGKQELENIANTISGTYTQVNDVKHNIENTKLVVRVEKKKLMISF